jgi:hypothetical protein
MKTKNVYKIGLSIFIALALILPSATFMASSIGSREADDSNNSEYREYRKDGLFQQQGIPILDEGFFLENPAGGKIEIPYGPSPGITIPIEEYYRQWLCMSTDLGQIPVEVKPHLEIYEFQDGLEIIMYETSFEDNFDIYNNWVQIDEDCGMGGYFDSWSWSDARASDGDHSMKSTMYDIYKGNQDDYLECLIPFDMCGQSKFIVYFDVWVEGQYDDITTPWDYVSFEIGNGTVWIENLTLDPSSGAEYKFFDTTLPLVWQRQGYDFSENVENLGGGWWRVKFEMDVDDLATEFDFDCSDIRFRFDWHSDPQFQYEGGYVDNFKVISIESEEEKIFQAHSQGPYVLLDHFDCFEFPLNWYPPGPGCYKAILWLECLTIPEYNSTFDWPGHTYYFCIGDNLDCQITDLFVEDSFTLELVEDGGIMTEGSDAHIVFEYHQGGNIPAENIEIKATATKFEWDIEYEQDFEGNVNPLTDNYGEMHISDRDAFTGSKSLGWFEEDTWNYPYDAFWYAYGPDVDFAAVEEAYMDYYWKANTDPGDWLYPSILDNFNSWVFGSGFGNTYGTRMGGYETEWIGPTENGYKYTRTDLVAMYNHYAPFLDGTGEEVTEMPVGFFFTTDGDDQIYHPDSIEDGVIWAGVFLDDLKITTKKLGDEVYTETIIIPGPLEPCDYYDAQFEWEDVPFSNYRICVEALCEGDVNISNNKRCQDILIVDNLERATLKDLESVDYTDDCQDEWGICSSDYDNYMSTNPTYEYYSEDVNSILELCPDGDSCINISGLTLGDVEFDAWWELENGADFVYLEIHDGCPADYAENWVEVKNWTNNSFAIGDGDGWYHEVIDITSFVTGDEFVLRFRFESDVGTEMRGFIFDDFEIGVGVFGVDTMDSMDNWCAGCFAYGDYWDDWCLDIPDYDIDTALIWSTEIKDAYEAYLLVSHNYTFQNRQDIFIDDLSVDWSVSNNWTTTIHSGDGNFEWHSAGGAMIDPLNLFGLGGTSGSSWNCSLISKSLDMAGLPEDVTFIWTGGTYVWTDVKEVWLWSAGAREVRLALYDPTTTGQGNSVSSADKEFVFDPDDLTDPSDVQIEFYMYSPSTTEIYCWFMSYVELYSATPTAIGYLDISDDGGETWHNLDGYTGHTDGECFDEDPYDITEWAGSDVLIRFHFVGNEFSTADRYWCICDLMITGKTDETAPSSSATMSGTMKESGWYTTGVKVTITAEDIGAGMGEIHYILDGSETVVAGDSAEFTVSGNGEHNIEFWAVDAMGNEETPHNVIPTFRIDMGSAPSVAITAPEPGLYLFGNKLLSASKVIIIGAFTVEATASDAESGIYRVQFFLDGDLISEDTEMPFSAYVAEKHMGAGTIKVVAEDFAQNTAEDTLDITYYKFL